jgi:hypothetical protein
MGTNNKSNRLLTSTFRDETYNLGTDEVPMDRSQDFEKSLLDQIQERTRDNKMNESKRALQNVVYT